MKRRYILFILIPVFLFLFQNITYAQLDFGDAPDPSYPTLSVNNGPNHIVGTLFLVMPVLAPAGTENTKAF